MPHNQLKIVYITILKYKGLILVVDIGGFVITSFVVSLIALIPTIILAIFVERHYVGFWNGVWNCFALVATGISGFILPVNGVIINLVIGEYIIPLWGLLVLYGLIVFIVGLKFSDSDAIQNFAGSRLSASFLLMFAIASHFLINSPIILGIIVIVSYSVLYYLKENFMP